MVKRNSHFSSLKPNYLFPEIAKRVQEFKQKHPQARCINLSVGDTSQPLPSTITTSLKAQSEALGTREGYRGYASEQGNELLRAQIAENLYHNRIDADEIFISDGAKCDIGRLQVLFGTDVTVGVQDPTYPAYAESSRLVGQKDLRFFSQLPEGLTPVDLLFLCSPNNPTGETFTKRQLSDLITFAKQNKTIILFDSSYAGYIRDPQLPRSIYEIEGAHEVAIEISSFSKLIGFTGVRLGWTIVPHALQYDDGGSVRADWKRLVSTIFNGASNIAQAGGIAALSPIGRKEIENLIHFYLENAQLLKKALVQKGFPTAGGEHAPYLWVNRKGKDSWTLFQELLEKAHLIATPGVGFGPAGEGFLRFSAFGKREEVLEACKRIERL